MEAEVKHPVRLSGAILFDSLFAVMILAVFSVGGLFPIHLAAFAFGTVIAGLTLIVKGESDIRRLVVPVIVIGFISMVLFGQWPLIPVILLSVFFLWRTLSRSNHHEAHQITTIQLILLLIVFIATYNIQLTYELNSPGIIIISIIGGFILYSSVPYFSSYSGKKALKLYGKWSGIFTVSGITLYIFMDPLKKLIFGAADHMIASINDLIYLTGFDISITQLEDEDFESSQGGELENREQFNVSEIEQTVSIGTIEVIILIGVLILSVFLIWKMLKKFNEPLSRGQTVQENVTIERNELQRTSGEKNVIPNHIIRKEMLKLEKKAQKKNAGRRKSETVREWFTRLNLQDSKSNAGIYEKIRYADGEITESEYKAFHRFVKDFEKRINEI